MLVSLKFSLSVASAKIKEPLCFSDDPEVLDPVIVNKAFKINF